MEGSGIAVLVGPPPSTDALLAMIRSELPATLRVEKRREIEAAITSVEAAPSDSMRHKALAYLRDPSIGIISGPMAALLIAKIRG